MKILRVPSYCEPERISSSHLEHDLYQKYVESGFEFEVYAPTPTRGLTDEEYENYKNIKYSEKYDGAMKIYRFSMFREGKNPIIRALRYILVHVQQYRVATKAQNIDLINCGSTPPTQGMMCALIAKKLSKKYGKKVPFVFNLQDIFPDSLVTTGLTSQGSVIWKFGRKIEDFTYKNADKIIVINESFKRNIMKKGVSEEKIQVVSNWIDTDEVRPIAKEENHLYDEFSISKDKFTVLYAGNFGAAQGAEVIIEAAEFLKDNNNIQFVIFGGGSEFEAAKEMVEKKKLQNVIINSLLPHERVSEVYSVGDVALITCKKGVGNSGMPSKTWSIMACNTPIIASFDVDSELAEIIEKAGAGVCVEPGNSESLVSAILKRYENKNNGENYNSRDFVIANASKDVCVEKYVEVLTQQVNDVNLHV